MVTHHNEVHRSVCLSFLTSHKLFQLAFPKTRVWTFHPIFLSQHHLFHRGNNTREKKYIRNLLYLHGYIFFKRTKMNVTYKSVFFQLKVFAKNCEGFVNFLHVLCIILWQCGSESCQYAYAD